MYDRTPQFFLFTDSEGRRLLLFKKHWMISVRLTVFVLWTKEYPKKAHFQKFQWTNFYESFFQSHLKYISNMNIMENCICMFKTSLIFNKNEIKILKKIHKLYFYAVEKCPVAWRGAANVARRGAARRGVVRHMIYALLGRDR